MSSRPYFRFTLRSLLLFVAMAAVASWWYRSHLVFQRSPAKADGGGGYRITGDPQHLRSRIYRDHDDRLIAIFLLAFDELDVNGPQFQLKHAYNSREGGRLLLDGVVIEPRSKPRVFANDPLGRMVELNLTVVQMEALARCQSASQLEKFYREIVEPLLVVRAGRSDVKGRQGRWTFRLRSGELYEQVAYSEGLRHGESTTYYRNGALKCQAFFQQGKPSGEWTLFDPDGNVLAIVDRRMDIDHRSRPKSNRHVKRWESQIDNERGYRLFVDGAELRMPR